MTLRFICSYAILILLTFESETEARFHVLRLRDEKKALRNALEDIRVLQGFLPICAGCKSIRDDQGFWSSVELYLARHSMARITDAFCPECRAHQGLPAEVDSDGPATPHRPPNTPRRRHDVARNLHYLRTCLFSVTVMGLLFGSPDIGRGHLLEALIELGMAALSLLLAIGLGRWFSVAGAGHVFAVTIITFMGIELWIGGSGGHVFLWSLVLPPIFTAIFGRREGTSWSLVLFSVMAAVFAAPEAHAYPTAVMLQFGLVFLFLTAMAFGLESARELLEKRRQRENLELAEALDHAATLRGILPLCPSCKKVRDDDGFWRQVEDYLATRTGASTSHGFCPTCSEKELRLIHDYKAESPSL